MTKDTPSPAGAGSRHSPKKAPGGPGSAAAAAAALLLEEQRRELEAVRAELEAERARSQAERRRFTAEARELRESGERERQQLTEQLRSRWEAQRVRELRQLQEAVLRERDAEIRQLLRWKEAELRQLQQQLHRERDCAVRQARDLQRQLADELLNRGYGGRQGGGGSGGAFNSSMAGGAAQCRCRLQDVLAKLRWETDGEQAARIRHLQAALDVERSLFLKYILENFHWDPAAVLSGPAVRSQNRTPNTEPAIAMAIISGAATPALEGAGELPPGLSSRAAVTGPAAAPAPTLAERVRSSTLPSRPRSLDSLCPPRPRAPGLCLDNTSRSLDGSPGRAQSPPGSGEPEDRSRLQLGGGEKGPEAEGAPPTMPSPRPTAYSELVKQNSELAEALDTLARHCSGLRHENSQLRRGLPEADEKVQRLKLKNVELAGIAKRLEERARKLHETNLRTPAAAPASAPAAAGRASQGPPPGPAAGNPSRSAVELCRQAFARQRAKDLTEQTSALQAKDKQIEDLRQECRDLQARMAACQATAGQGSAQWLNVNDFDHLLRESQKEVLRLQRQVTLQKCFKGSHPSRAPSPRFRPQSPRREGEDKEDKEEEERKAAQEAQQAQQAQQAQEAQELKLQLQALEEKLSERQKCCESLQLDVGKVQQRLQEAEGLLQRLTTENNRLAQENSRFQEKMQWAEKVDSENSDLRGRLEQVTKDRDAATLLTAQLQQQVSQVESSRQKLEKELQEALATLAAQQEEVQRQQRDQEQLQREHEEALQALQAQIRELERPSIQKAKEIRRSQLPRGKWAKKVTRPLEGPGLPDSGPAVQKASTQASATNAGPGPLGLLASPTPQALTASAAAAVPSDPAPEPESPTTDSHSGHSGHSGHDPSKLKIFLARYNYDPYAGPNEQPEAELALTAGEYIYIFGDMDEDGFYSGELMNGQTGLVPSNLVEQISDSEILNFQLPEGSDLCLDPSQEVKPLGGGGESTSPEGRGTDYSEDSSCCDLLPKTLEKYAEEEEDEEALDFSGVPCPQKLTLLQQLPRAVVVGWERPRGNHPYGAMQGYNVYVDRELWQNIRAGAQKQVTVEELDLKTRAYRISVQSVMERGCSNPLACSFLVGQDFCLAPTRLRLKSLSPTSAEISWLYSNSNYPHMVRLNEQEHSLAEAGVCRYVFPDLQPSSRYCVHVEVRPPGEASGKPWKEMASSIAFTTPLAGPPDPPLDVLVECHSSPGSLLVSWIPVTIDSAGSSNGVPVTGYAVYADGQKVTEVASPTAGNVVLEFSQLQRPKLFQEVSVRTTSHYGESLDSVPAQIPGEWCKQASAYPSPQAFPVNHNCGDPAHPHIPAPSRLPVPTGQEKSVLASFNTKASSPFPAGCGRPKVAVAWDGLLEDACRRRSPKPSEGELLSPRDAGAPPGPGEARTPSPLSFGRKDAYGPKAGKDCKLWGLRHISDGPPAGEERSARNAVLRVGRGKELLISPPPESGQGREISRENYGGGGGKAPRSCPEADTPKGSSSQLPEAYAVVTSPEEEDQYVTPWGARTIGPKKEIRLGRGASRPAGRKKEAPPPPPRPLLYQSSSEKMTKILKTGPVGPGAALWFRPPENNALKGKTANHPVRVFVALWDYDPQLMSANHATAQEELTFHRGQILKVWGDRDPDGFYHGECSGRMGYIPGNLVSEVQVEGSDVLKQLLQQGHLPSEVSLDGLVGLPTQPPGPQKSFSVARGGPRRAQLWHPQTMVAAFDYQPRKSSSLSVTEELTLSAGDVVTVLGSVDDNGFLYGELNGQRGLVPWNLLKTPALNGEE